MKSSTDALFSAMKMYLKNTKEPTISLKMARNAAEEMVEEYEKTQWVLCSERLPEPYVDVLVTLKPVDESEDGSIDIACRINENKWQIEAGRIDSDWIVAWMPLPKFYQEADHE